MHAPRANLFSAVPDFVLFFSFWHGWRLASREGHDRFVGASWGWLLAVPVSEERGGGEGRIRISTVQTGGRKGEVTSIFRLVERVQII